MDVTRRGAMDGSSGPLFILETIRFSQNAPGYKYQIRKTA